MQVLDPLFDQIVVRELEPDQMRKSGILLPPGAANGHMPPQEGIVIAAGPGMDWWPQHGVEMPVKVGDHVVFPHHCGVYVEVEEERLLVLRVGQLIGVMREERRPQSAEDALRGWAS